MYDLRALQLKEVEILQSVHDCCDKLGIEYMIHYGTLIGAVRHKGFIPWDDDIDIVMTWENYDRFINEAPAILPENLKIQHWKFEPDCPNVFAKVRDANTCFVQAEHVDLDICQGVFIDIFPITRIKDDPASRKREMKREDRFSIINKCLDKAFLGTIVRKKSKLIAKFLHAFFAKGPFKIRNRAQFIAKEENRMRDLSSNGYDNTYIFGAYCPYAVFTERELFDFEGHKFYGPKDYDTALRTYYGDYMIIPPKEQQITHAPLFVDLERGYNRAEIKSILSNLPH